MPKLTDWLMERAAQADPGRAEKARAPRLQHAWYKVNGMTVHVDGRGLPAPCARCRGLSEFRCDYEVVPGVLCCAPLCPAHAKPIGRGKRAKHLCPIHARRVLTDAGPLL